MSPKERFESILLELATRKNNEHVGSGLGGNAEQFAALLAVTPQFDSSNEVVFVLDNLTLFINSEKFLALSKRQIREELNVLLTKDLINKLVPVSELPLYLEGKEIQSSSINQDLLFPAQKLLAKAFILANKLRELVDEDFNENIATSKLFNDCSSEFKSTALELNEMPSFYVLPAVRICIGIDRLVKYNLDETLDFLLNSLNKKVEAP